MSRSGYSEDYDYDTDTPPELYRQAVRRAIHGKRGQKLLKEALAALDAMEVKELVAHDFVRPDGACCTLGAVAKARNWPAISIEVLQAEAQSAAECEWGSDLSYTMADEFDIAEAMAREIMWMNDEAVWEKETPAERWTRMRDWIARQIDDTE